MLSISEWLPNPAGKDTGSEWVELFNSGNGAASLSGWVLKNGKGDRASLSGIVPAHGYLVLSAKDLRMNFRNTNESLFLFDPSGNLADESHFFGVAPSGKSVNLSATNDPLRPSFSEASAGHMTRNSFFAVPTPGAPNAETGTALIASQYPESGVISHSLGGGGAAGLLLGTALLMALCVTIAIIHHDDLRESFFPTHEEIR